MSENEPTSVFTDDTGTRARALVRTGRAVLALLGLGLAAVVFSLVTRVPLPGLDGPVHLPGSGTGGAARDKHVERPEPSSGPTGTTPVVPVVATTGADGPAGGSSPRAPSATTVPTSGPTASTPSSRPTPTGGPTPTKGPKKNVKSSDAPRATPPHTPGSGQPTPPGKAK